MNDEKVLSFQERAGKAGGGKGILIQDDMTGSLVSGNTQSVAYGIGRDAFNSGSNAQFGMSIEEDVQPPITAKGAAADTAADEKACFGFDPGATRDAGDLFTEEVSKTLANGSCPGHHNGVCLPDEPRAVDFQNFREQGVNGSLQATSCHNTASNNAVRQNYVVRRLMPIECERLQGFPDDWTDIGDWEDTQGRKHKTTDSARYKALGNSICLPGWKWILKRISAQYERDATMASLFDGIGGFPYLWEQINGKGTALWASEIDEFCIAVTKKRIG